MGENILVSVASDAANSRTECLLIGLFLNYSREDFVQQNAHMPQSLSGEESREVLRLDYPFKPGHFVRSMP